MASTSTNKQPLLVDRVMHVAVDMNDHKVAEKHCHCWQSQWF